MRSSLLMTRRSADEYVTLEGSNEGVKRAKKGRDSNENLIKGACNYEVNAHNANGRCARALSSAIRVNSCMQSLLQKVSFYLCLHPMNNEDKMIPSAAVTA